MVSIYLPIVKKYGGVVSNPDELYTELFHLGEHLIQRSGEYRNNTKEYKGNPMLYINDAEDFRGKMKRYILLEDTFLDQIHEAQKEPSNLINAISYFGRKKDKEHSDRCFGLIFDLDDIDEKSFNNFLFGMSNGLYPCPNYIVISKSGKGAHLYYILDEPLRLFPKIKLQLKDLKYSLIQRMWNPVTSNNEHPQLQSYDQSFMIAGTYDTMEVYKMVNQKAWSIEELSDYSNSVVFDKSELWIETKCTLDEAKELYPEWYEKVIVNGDKSKGTWTCNRAVYDWWLKKIQDPDNGATYGHRYWCIMMLVIYAVKSGVPSWQVRRDAFNLVPYLNSIKEDMPFTKDDAKSALDCYDIQFKHFPREDISRLSNIRIDPQKRNWQKQEDHLEEARAIRDIRQRRKGMEWYENSPHTGRKPKESIVREWQERYPEGKPKECIEDTGLNKNTVYKWWQK